MCICVYMCVYVCICVYMCVYVCMCVYTCVHVCICVYMCVYVCICVYMCVYVCICVYMCVYVCTCVYMCVYVCRIYKIGPVPCPPSRWILCLHRHTHTRTRKYIRTVRFQRMLVLSSCGATMRWLQLVGCSELYVSFATEPYQRDDILQKRPIILRSLLIGATLSSHCDQKRLCLSRKWLRLVGSLKLSVSFAEYRLFYRSRLQKRPVILRSLLIAASPQLHSPLHLCVERKKLFFFF